MSDKKSRPYKPILIVAAILIGIFGWLAYIANPQPPTPEEIAASPEVLRPLSEVLARMAEDKSEKSLMGANSIAAQALKMKASEKPDFFLGPFNIGMNYQEFLAATAGQNKVLAVDTGVMGVYNLLPDRFNAYFRNAEDQEKAFRISYHRSLGRRLAEDVKAYLIQIWGKPSKTDCGPSIDRPGETCVLTWWPVNAVRVEASVAEAIRDPDGKAEIDLTVNAYVDEAAKLEDIQNQSRPPQPTR